MIEAASREKTAKMGIDIIDIATSIHRGGSISFTNPFNGSTSQSFDNGNPFSEGLAAVELSTDRWCHIDEELKPIYQARYDWVGDFHQGLAPASLEDDMFHIGRDGRITYSNRYSFVGPFTEEMAVASNKSKWAFHILPNGKPAYRNRFFRISEFREGLAVVQSAYQDRWHYIDHFGLPQGMGRFFSANPFKQGLAAIQLEEGVAYHIDHAGRAAYQSRFQEAGDFSENLATAAKEVKCDDDVRTGHFHISRTGRKIYDETYDSVHGFRHGIAMVRNFSRKTIYIDTRGRKIKH